LCRGGTTGKNHVAADPGGDYETVWGSHSARQDQAHDHEQPAARAQELRRRQVRRRSFPGACRARLRGRPSGPKRAAHCAALDSPAGHDRHPPAKTSSTTSLSGPIPSTSTTDHMQRCQTIGSQCCRVMIIEPALALFACSRAEAPVDRSGAGTGEGALFQRVRANACASLGHDTVRGRRPTQ
jgi:hypothetical protein